MDAFFELYLKNMFGDECSLSFTAEDEQQMWEELIIQQIIEISPSKNRRHRSVDKQEQLKIKEQEKRDAEETKFVFGFNAPSICFNMLDANFEGWVCMELREFDFQLKGRAQDSEVAFHLMEVTVKEVHNMNYPYLFSSKSTGKQASKPLLDFKLK